MSDSLEDALRVRAENICELCGDDGSTGGLEAFEVGPEQAARIERCVLACETCLAQLQPGASLQAKHWLCLNSAIWSEVPAVQVVSYRLLQRLSAESWAQDLLGQAYLEDSVLAWAKEESAGDDSDDAQVDTLDSNGAVLVDGDSVTLIKDLDVKGAGFVAKRGTLVKSIRLIAGDPDNIEGRVNKIGLVLKTCFLKKSV